MLIISLYLGLPVSSRHYTESLRYELFTRGEYNLTIVRSSSKEKSCYVTIVLWNMQYCYVRLFYEICYDETFYVMHVLLKYEASYEWWNIFMMKVLRFTISLWCFKVQCIYDHDACHLNNQVITKLKVVPYRPFSLCRPKGIKETVFMYVMYVSS